MRYSPVQHHSYGRARPVLRHGEASNPENSTRIRTPGSCPAYCGEVGIRTRAERCPTLVHADEHVLPPASKAHRTPTRSGEWPGRRRWRPCADEPDMWGRLPERRSAVGWGMRWWASLPGCLPSGCLVIEGLDAVAVWVEVLAA